MQFFGISIRDGLVSIMCRSGDLIPGVQILVHPIQTEEVKLMKPKHGNFLSTRLQ